MATTTKTAGNKKSGAKSSETTAAKQCRTFKEWRGDIQEAKGIGFAHGYDCIEELPRNLMGGRRAAENGFRQGTRAREQAQKAEATARKYRKYTY